MCSLLYCLFWSADSIYRPKPEEDNEKSVCRVLLVQQRNKHEPKRLCLIDSWGSFAVEDGRHQFCRFQTVLGYDGVAVNKRSSH